MYQNAVPCTSFVPDLVARGRRNTRGKLPALGNAVRVDRYPIEHDGIGRFAPAICDEPALGVKSLADTTGRGGRDAGVDARGQQGQREHVAPIQGQIENLLVLDDGAQRGRTRLQFQDVGRYRHRFRDSAQFENDVRRDLLLCRNEDGPELVATESGSLRRETVGSRRQLSDDVEALLVRRRTEGRVTSDVSDFDRNVVHRGPGLVGHEAGNRAESGLAGKTGNLDRSQRRDQKKLHHR